MLQMTMMLSSRAHTAQRPMPVQGRQPPQQRWRRPPLAAAPPESEAATAPAAAGKRYEVTLPKPAGVVFASKEGGSVFIESVVPGGNADKAGLKAGDVLTACSAVTLKVGLVWFGLVWFGLVWFGLVWLAGWVRLV